MLKTSKSVVKWNFHSLISSVLRKEIVKKLLDYISLKSNYGHCFTEKRSLYVG